MITWIQLVLQKHHKWVFSVLLVVIIIAFVFTIGQVPFLGDRNRAWDKSTNFYGFNLSDRNVAANLQNSAFYEAILGGMQIQTDEQLMQMVMRQAYLLSVAKDLGIRQVSERELGEYIKSAPAFQNENGSFNEQNWDIFKSQRVGSGRMSEEALTSILAQNALIAKISKLLGGPGYVLKSEIEREYNVNYGVWDFNLAILSYADFKPEIKSEDKALEEYFKANIEAYRIGEGVVLETVFIPSAKYAAAVSAPSDEEVAAFFGANMRKYSVQKDGQASVPQLSEVKEKVKADMIADSALRKAALFAEDVSMSIYESQAKKGSSELKKILDEAKLELKKWLPIRSTDTEAPKGLPVSVASVGIKLDEMSFYSDPVKTPEGIWIVFLSERLQSYLPNFADVKERVLKDYLASEKSKLFAERGAAVDAIIKKAVSEGKSFEEAAKAQGAKVSSAKDFSFTKFGSYGSDIMGAFSVIRSELPKLKEGEVSDMQTLSQNGYILNLVKFSKPASETNSEAFNRLAKNIQEAFSSFSSTTVVSDMIQAASEQEK